MRFLKKTSLALLLLLSGSLMSTSAQTPIPDAIAAPGETVVLTLHAEGAQVYECKAGADGKLAWAFREPVATLLLDGKTVGRHYAGPSWEHTDGSAVVGKAAGNAPGKTASDIRSPHSRRSLRLSRVAPFSFSSRRLACVSMRHRWPQPSRSRG